MSHEHVNGKKKCISQIYEKLEGPHDGQVLWSTILLKTPTCIKLLS